MSCSSRPPAFTPSAISSPIRVFRCARDDVRVWAPDVGGGFGIKNCLYPGMGHAALGRPQTRPAGQMGRGQDRGFPHRRPRPRQYLPRPAGAGCRRASSSALDVETIAGLGAYMSGGGPGSSTNAPAAAMGGGYVIPAIHMDVRAAFTNTGADRRLSRRRQAGGQLPDRTPDRRRRARNAVSIAIELRRRNLIAAFPYRKALGTLVDCGRFAANIDDVLAQADLAGFPRARRAVARHGACCAASGCACFLETARGAPNEGAEIRFHPDGTIALLVGTQSNGQGHETSLPADRRRPVRPAARDRSVTSRATPRRCARATAMAARARCTGWRGAAQGGR